MQSLTGLSITGDILAVTVGNEAQKFNTHEGVVCSHSRFFDTALSKCWKEGRERHIELPEDDPEIVEVYFKFLYAEKLFIEWTRVVAQVKSNENLPEYLTLAQFYVFGEKVGDVKFKSAVMDAFITGLITPFGGTSWTPVTRVADILYCGTVSGSPVRRLMVDAHVLRAGEHWITESPDDNNLEFLMDLTRILIRNRTKSASRSFSTAIEKWTYHEETGSKATTS